MRVAVVVAAMLFCMSGCSREEPRESVVVEPRESATNSIGMELTEIPAGSFTMGCPAGEKGHQEDEAQVRVTLTKPFGLGKTEVTQGQWKSVMGSEPWDGEELVKADKDCPATYVSYFDAVEFCDTLTEVERKAGKLKADEEYRLPTEAQWEYACRAGTTTAFSFGDESKLNAHAWWGGFDLEALNKGEIKAGPGNAAREQYAHTVGMKKPNPWGLHDMHGNVNEWCSDWYGEELAGGTDPIGPNRGSLRVIRGGGWRNDPGVCRSADRNYFVPSDGFLSLGFRVARSRLETVTRPKMEKTEPVEKSGESVTNSISMELIEIPVGKFTMGSPEDEKDRLYYEAQVAVTLTKPFKIGKYEVTQGQWKSVMESEPWKGKDHVEADKDCPATYVNWNDATKFCEKLTAIERKAGKLKAGEEYRLPTEAQWEYACRAGTKTAFSFGDNPNQLGKYGWFDGKAKNVGEQYAHKVGLKKPNPWGLYDMHGNVAEWCSDWHDYDLSGGTDPVGPVAKPQGIGGVEVNRVIRSGSWSRFAGLCRSASRNSGSIPSYRDSALGFRVARSQSAQ